MNTETSTPPSPFRSWLYLGMTLMYIVIMGLLFRRDPHWAIPFDATLLLVDLICLVQFASRIATPAHAALRLEQLTTLTRAFLRQALVACVVLGTAGIVLQFVFEHGSHTSFIRFYILLILAPTAINDVLGNPDPTPKPPPSIVWANSAPLRSTHWGRQE